MSFGTILSLAALPAVAQTNNPSPAKNDEVIELTPFVVDASKDTGYQAQNTLSGTRLNSKVGDLGTTMTILTPDVWNDLGVFSTNDLILFTPGGEKNDYQSGADAGNGQAVFFGDQTRFRGIAVENIVRNNFRTEIPSDTYNADRFEFTRGPNAILFGVAGDASGAVNRTTQNALLNKNAYEYSLQVDNFGSVRNTLNLNQVLLKDKLAVKVVGLDSDQERWLKPIDYQDQSRMYYAVQYKPMKRVNIKATYERFNSERAGTSGSIPLDGVTPWIAAGKLGRASLPTYTGANVSNPAGVSAFTNKVNALVAIFDGSSSEPLLENWNNHAVGANQTVLGNTSIALPLSFIDRRLDLGGDSSFQQMHGGTFNAFVDVEVTKDLLVQFAVNDESVNYNLISSGGSRLQVDASTTLSTGAANPNFGRYFTTLSPSFSLNQDRYRRDRRATASYHFDFAKSTDRLKWLGSHDLAAMYEQDTSEHFWDVLTLRNTTPLPGSSAKFNDASNLVRFVNYVDLDTNTIHGLVGAFEMQEVANKMPGVNAQWLPTGNLTSYKQTLASQLYVLQSHFWDNRLVTTLGWRQDDISYVSANQPALDAVTGLRPYARTAARVSVPDIDGVSPINKNYGAVFHVIRNKGIIDDIGLTFNHSTSFSVGLGGHYIDGSLLPPQTGTTKDFGLRAELFDRKIGVVATVFESAVKDIHDLRVDTTIRTKTERLFEMLGRTELLGISEVRDKQDKISKGYELQVTGNITPNWRVMGSISTYETINSNVALFTGEFINKWKAEWLKDPAAIPPNGTTNAQQLVDSIEYEYLLYRASEGSRALNERQLKVVGVTNYSFSTGSLKGVSVGANFVWQDKPQTGYGLKSVNNPSTGLPTFVPNPENPFYGSPLMNVGASLGYKRKIMNNRVQWSVQLNVRNLLKVEPFQVRTIADPLAPDVAVVRQYARGEPTTYTLTNTFKF